MPRSMECKREEYDCPACFNHIMLLPYENNCLAWLPRTQFHYLTRDDWEEVVRRVDRWYESVPTKQMKEWNEKLELERQEMTGEYVTGRGEVCYHKPLPKKPKPGYIYVLSGAGGLYKLGVTRHPKDRIATISKGCPWPVAVEFIREVSDPYGLELSLKEHFVSKKSNGEWFRLTPEDVEYIKGLAE